MGDSLNPSPLHRLSRALRPDWARTTAARRVLAAALVVLASVAALRDDPGARQTDVLIASRDLAPGTELTAADVVLEKRDADVVPDGSVADLDATAGATLAGPVRRGEVLTDVRLLSPHLAGAAAGPDARIVPLTLADAAVLDLLRPGDVLDVVAAAPEADTEPRLIATGAIVVLVSAETTGLVGGSGNRVVLVALPATAARTVAAAALVDAIGVTLH
ncbi:SAF domain-containing protein [Mycolicibacterium poriferae]|uniref:SAF domain-containing protein n=1 Tax=Mycolicibacterium poriferae TaxID=39694 RepID=UPI0024BBE68D|nr:SAF domain-containing protein [Mycolicibacterium poriferae]